MSEELQWAQAQIRALRNALATVFLGQDDVLDSMLLGCCLAAMSCWRPSGVGETFTVKSLARRRP